MEKANLMRRFFYISLIFFFGTSAVVADCQSHRHEADGSWERPTLSDFIGDYDSPTKCPLDSTLKVVARVVAWEDGIKILIDCETNKKSNFNSSGMDVIFLRQSGGRYAVCGTFTPEECRQFHEIPVGRVLTFPGANDTIILMTFVDSETIEYMVKSRSCWIGIPHTCFFENPFFRDNSLVQILKRRR